MVQITGKYKRTSEKRYEDFLSKLGLNFMIRKAALSSIPTMEITKSEDKWKLVTATKLRNVILEFELVCGTPAEAEIICEKNMRVWASHCYFTRMNL